MEYVARSDSFSLGFFLFSFLIFHICLSFLFPSLSFTLTYFWLPLH